LIGANARFIKLKFTNNGAAANTDSIRLRYTSGCGNSATKAQKLSNLAISTLTSFSILSQTKESDLLSTTKELKFSQLVEIFKQSLSNTTFDATSPQGQLNKEKEKNQKLLTAISEVKKYLANLDNNLINYKK
jgi:valyl-tRNA synthetase